MVREKEIGRDRGGRERQGRKRKNYKHKKFMEFYLVVLYCAERSEARQWIVARHLSCFNPVTRDKVGKEKIERETGWEREKDITRGKEFYRGDRNGPVPL